MHSNQKSHAESDGNQEKAAQEYVGELMEKASSAGQITENNPSPDKKPSAREESAGEVQLQVEEAKVPAEVDGSG